MVIGGSYVLQVLWKGVQHTVVVWNGVKDYERHPVPAEFDRMNMGDFVFGEKVVIAQVSKQRATIELLAILLDYCDSVVLWTRDTEIYESVRDELRLAATHNADGTPMTKQ